MSPTLYIIRKFKLRDVLNQEYKMKLNLEQEKMFYIKQQDNMMFRQIRLITDYDNEFNPYIVFIDCKGFQNETDIMRKLLTDGFSINGKKFIFTERSASMCRNAIIGFIDEEIEGKLNERITMDLEIDKTVISKYTAYRGLMFSSCFFIEGKLPYIIVVDDFERVIPNQHIKSVREEDTSWVDKVTGEIKYGKTKNVFEGYQDVPVTPADGSGMHIPELSKKWADAIGITTHPSVFMCRMPFVKGLTIEVDFRRFYRNKGITHIKDIWGVEHSVDEVECIWTKSMYKGVKYFKKTGTYSDWENYLAKFYKHNHCLGIAKWNFLTEEEPLYTRVNYQYLQTLKIEKEDMIELGEYSKRWAENIITGDPIYTYKFLGMENGGNNPSNKYMKAITLHSGMLQDFKVKEYLFSLLKKYMDEFKMGKLWVKGCFKILIPDVIMMMESAGGLPVVGCLGEGEFYAYGLQNGEYLIDRNPHICPSEHTILAKTSSPQIRDYLSHLENVCMLNSYDITTKRLNGADTDGDLVFVTNNEIMRKGVQRDLPIVIDVDDKITALDVQYNKEGVINYMLMSLDSRIGEISNVATCYLNKQTKDEKTKERFNDYVCLLSVINGKEIDYAKTGMRWLVPYHIAKYARPLPYFMKYAGYYYSKLKMFSKANCNLNHLCWDVEKWQKGIRFKRKSPDTSEYMIDKSQDWDDGLYKEVEKVFIAFNKEMVELGKQSRMAENYSQYKSFFEGYSKAEIQSTDVNWDIVYEKYKAIVQAIVPNPSELANYAVHLSYIKYPSKAKNFCWVITEEGLFLNLEKNREMNIMFPAETFDRNDTEYLGHYYRMEELFDV
jgi:hypothetical protein